ncbi:PEP/pyruvate-binding domain-containing protein [Pseudonocardia eucalypti]|uniref:PEP/pyruvate-binding domain-containing protein n=1 Tax=Pseudonocardia eucalypti TaxID=648755 RepID=A0ABP9PUL9_9PSEU|nr:pyruvate,water dikinase [Pseudonocardia eucalypti]
MSEYLRRFDELGSGDVGLAGGKAANLGELTRAGLPVPPGFVLTTPAYDRFVEATGIGPEILELSRPGGDYDRASERIRALFTGREIPAEIAAQAVAAYRELGEPPVAVRSSATAEDLKDASFAGQQDTYLNVRGSDALLTAVRDCWASLWTARALAYRERRHIAPDEVSLAVVVQEMVPFEPDTAAGVMFTANPANGRRDQIAVSAAWGLGEAVVSGAVSTDDLVIESGRVRERNTADKQVMTVTTERGTEEVPVDDRRRREPVLDDRDALRLAALGARIAGHYGAPQDIEWVRSHGELLIVQSRPVTALPEPVGEVPTTWPEPYPKGYYFRASIVEQMPDPLSPLFADMIDGSVTRSLGALMNRAFGRAVMREGDIRFPTINGYAFYYYRRAAMWRMLLRSPAAMPKILFRRNDDFGVSGWRGQAHPRYVEALRAWAGRPVGQLSDRELLDGAGQLLDAGTTYYTAVQSVIPQAALSEMYFQAFYNRLVRRKGDPPAVEFLVGYDSQPIRAEKSLYDLAKWVGAQPGLADQLNSSERPPELDPEVWREWRERFDRHLAEFGHVAYNLDFAAPVPADEPGTLLDALRFHLGGQGGDPHERQRRSADRREAHTRAVRSRLGPVRRALFDRLLRRAQDTGPAREDALADISLAWPAIRRMLLELGRRHAGSGILPAAEDVFWLRHRELASHEKVPAEVIAERRMTWRGQRRANPPQMLPEIGWMKRALARAMPAGDQSQTGDVITGVGASAGEVTAPARVLGGPEEFGQMRPGEVLVARMTTPAWTSLFAMASAVVTDVGGPLSHSSIVAREYGIPAVLGTGVATQRLASGQRIHVDGDAGKVTPAD